MEDEEKSLPSSDETVDLEPSSVESVPTADSVSAPVIVADTEKEKPKRGRKKKLLTEGKAVKSIKLYVKPGGMRNFSSDRFKITESQDRLTVTVVYKDKVHAGKSENYNMKDCVAIEYK